MARLLLVALLACFPATAFAEAPGRTPSCWTHGYNSRLCFDGLGNVTAISISLDPILGVPDEALETSGRSWHGGGSIHFETDALFDPWPWRWSRVTCTLGGSDDVMELTDCLGWGTSYARDLPTERKVPVNDLTLTLRK